MNCLKCNTINDNENSFCVNCGEPLVLSSNLPPTMKGSSLKLRDEQPTKEIPFTGFQPHGSPLTFLGEPSNYVPPTGNQPSQENLQSSPAIFPLSQAGFQQPNLGFNQFQPLTPLTSPPQAQKSRLGLWLGLGALVLILLAGGIIVAMLLINKSIADKKEALPLHLGLFFLNSDKTQVSEIKKQEFNNALTGKSILLKDDSMPAIEPKPTFFLYSDNKDIPLRDLKLVLIDSVKNDGTIKEIEFKATPVQDKPDIKKIWIEDNLANGKYAFALFEGFLDDGKHRFWAFQVKDSPKNDNVTLAKNTSLSLKNTNFNSQDDRKNSETVPNTKVSSSPVTETKVPPPVGASTAYVRSNNVVLRAGPSQTYAKVGRLYKGQKVFVMQYSDNYETFVTQEGQMLYANYAYIQTESGKRGWVYTAFIR